MDSGHNNSNTHLIRPGSPTFAALGVRPETVQALASVGITHAFAIQEYALPIALRGEDVIGQAPTGTGKTLAFGIPLLQQILAPGEGATGTPQALVVVPTRELCLQVAKDLAQAGSIRHVRVLPIYGGVAYEPQVAALGDGVEILVGTPGRLLDLARSRDLRLDLVRALVLDEADRMLDLGFLDDVEQIMAMLPQPRQNMLFSATMPEPIVALARRFLHRPVTVHAHSTESTSPSPLTKQIVYRTHSLNKPELVARILQAEGRGLAIIFTRTKRAADRLSADLDFRGFAVAAVHGDLGQGARERALRAFRSGKVDILVATDVAARGLDVSGVTHVINYDCPEDPDTYVHRTGRTGRAGATGIAITLVDWEDMPRWALIDKTLGLEIPDPPETYHTSPHLYTDLSIPRTAGAVLPVEQRSRAGLAAEALENVEGKRSRRAHSSRRTRRRAPAHGGTPAEPAAVPGMPAAHTAEPGRRRRRRRRVSLASDTALADTALVDAARAHAVLADAARADAAPADATRHAAAEHVGQGTAVVEPAGTPRRRRRRRRQPGGSAHPATTD